MSDIIGRAGAVRDTDLFDLYHCFSSYTHSMLRPGVNNTKSALTEIAKGGSRALLFFQLFFLVSAKAVTTTKERSGDVITLSRSRDIQSWGNFDAMHGNLTVVGVSHGEIHGEHVRNDKSRANLLM